MVPRNSLPQSDNPNSEISLDDHLKPISDSAFSPDDLLKLIFDAVYRSYRIYHLSFNLADMEDITQSIALLLIKDDCRVLQSFDGRSSLETWLQKIANHKTIRFYRRRNGAMSLEDLSPDNWTYPPSQDNKVLWDEITRKLKLTKGQRELLELIYHGLKTGEIAKRRGTKPDSISKDKRRLFDKIGKLLKSKGQGNDKHSGD
jgi:RNA polymerase sigma factor (sigma-70 family)